MMMNSFFFDPLAGAASAASAASTGMAGAAIVTFLYINKGVQMFVIIEKIRRLRCRE
jgi:hypothetical protein